MNLSKLSAFCSKLSPTDLVAHLQSLVALVAAAKTSGKGKGENHSVDSDWSIESDRTPQKIESNTKLCGHLNQKKRTHKHDRFNAADIGTVVYCKLNKLYTPSMTNRLDMRSRKALDMCLQGIVVQKYSNVLIVYLKSVDVWLQWTPQQFYYDTLANADNRHITDAQMNNMKVNEWGKFELIQQLCVNSFRAVPNPTVDTTTSQITSTAKPSKVVLLPRKQDKYFPPTTVTQMYTPKTISDINNIFGQVKYRDSVVKNYPKFVAARVGDLVVFRLSGLYERRHIDDMSQREQDLLYNTTFDAVVVEKQSEDVVLHLEGVDLLVRLKPIKFDHNVNMVRGQNRTHLNSYALELLRRDNVAKLDKMIRLIKQSACHEVQHDKKPPSSGGRNGGAHNVVDLLSDNSSEFEDDDNANKDLDSDEGEEEEEGSFIAYRQSPPTGDEKVSGRKRPASVSSNDDNDDYNKTHHKQQTWYDDASSSSSSSSSNSDRANSRTVSEASHAAPRPVVIIKRAVQIVIPAEVPKVATVSNQPALSDYYRQLEGKYQTAYHQTAVSNKR